VCNEKEGEVVFRETAVAGTDRHVTVSLSLPVKTYLRLANQSEAAGQTLSLVIRQLIERGLETEQAEKRSRKTAKGR
jgi:macrodomain Ter protein organizer (MatP/YcbG family)